MSQKYLADELMVNARKPVGELGSKLIDMMNENHEKLAIWAVSHLNISKADIILDVGCGGGVNVKRFLEMTDGEVYGLDYSEVSVKKSSKLNRKAIDEKRCEIVKGSVSNMPFKDNTFDIVTSFESVYFWPDFLNDLKEVRRILKESGQIFIANEAMPIEGDERQKELCELLDANIYSKEELNEFLHNAGFTNINCYTKESKDSFTCDVANWICILAQK